MEIVILGVRGSIPSPSQATQFYGANTPCVEVRLASGELLIFDAGSGLRLLGETLPDQGECHLFITHNHNDHTAGLGFFKPFFSPGWTINLYLPESCADLLDRYFDGNAFPVRRKDLLAKINIRLVKGGEHLEIAQSAFHIETFATNHPGGNIAYKLRADGSVFLYTGDHEITADPELRALTRAALRGSDVAMVDAAFDRADFLPGWGHSSWQDWLELAEAENVPCLILSHHLPDRSDVELDALQLRLSNQYAGQDELSQGLLSQDNGRAVEPDNGQKQNAAQKSGRLWACVAREGMRFSPDVGMLPELYTSNWLQEFIDRIGQFKEESVILDTILKKTREVTQADAGTVFLLYGEELVFSYTHNDSMFPANESSKYAYASIRMPCTVESLAGYAAVTGKSLNIADVRQLPEDAPYHFNDAFDEKTGYRTQSTLTIPLVGKNQRIMGVLQLINSLNPRDKKPQPFTAAMEKTVKILAMEACKVLEISSTVTDNIYRLLHIASLHDPMETGPHAERVGAIAAEIYQVWAVRNGVMPDEALSYRGHLRLAAMLHDIGKVGISDNVLKKPGSLTWEEFEVIKTHTERGAALFEAEYQHISELAYSIALHHHQKWNGQGYGESGKKSLAGEEIPLAARITAIADVFDALVSSRCYKQPWTFEDAVKQIKHLAGRHFDPELVDCFMSILETVYMIYLRFPESLVLTFPSYQVQRAR